MIIRTEGYPILGPMLPLVLFMISMVLPILKLCLQVHTWSSVSFVLNIFWILDLIEEIRACEGYENSLKVRKQYNNSNLWGDLNLAYESIHFTFLESKRKGLRSKRLISGISTLPTQYTTLFKRSLSVKCVKYFASIINSLSYTVYIYMKIQWKDSID